MLPIQTIDVPFHPTSQRSPETAALAGQLRSVVNGVCDKYTLAGDNSALRVSKRFGFTQQTKQVYDASSGLNSSSAGFPEIPTLFGSYNRQQVVLSATFPYVLSEHRPGWAKFGYTVQPNALSRSVVYSSTTQVGYPDGASTGRTFCYTWQDLKTHDNYVFFVDQDGTPIRSPLKTGGTSPLPNAALVKVVSDGTLFWTVYLSSGVLSATAWDAHGVTVATNTIGTFSEGANRWFDVTFQQGNVYVATSSLTGSTTTSGLHKLTYASGTITVASSTPTMKSGYGIAFLENFGTTGELYIATSNPTGSVAFQTEFAYKVQTNGTVVQSWELLTTDGNGAHVGNCIELTGAMGNDEELNVLVSIRHPVQQRCVSQVFRCDIGGAVVPGLQLRQTLAASKTYQVGARTQNVLFYPSGVPVSYRDPATGELRQGFSQPTYFIVDLATQQLTGRFESSNAGGGWVFDQAPTPTNFGPAYFHLSHVFRDSDLVTHIPLGQLMTTVNESSVLRTATLPLATQSDIINIRTAPEAFTALDQFVQTATIGLSDYRIGSPGRSLEFAGELFLPGAMATSFTGYEFGENGLNLAPEQPTTTLQSVGTGLLTPLGTYSYVLVWEYTAPNGVRYRSAPSAAFTVSMVGSFNTLQISIPPLSMTNHASVSLGVYRTWMVTTAATSTLPASATPSTQYRKVSDDLNPTLNSTQSQTVTFIDRVSDDACQVGEVLYCGTGGQGFLVRDPCPGFSDGCVFGNRVFVIGWDNRIWYSSEFVDGEPCWFNSDVQTVSLPVPDRMVRLVPLDGRIAVLCESSIWVLNGTGFANPTGTEVSVIAPQRVPSNGGCTGLAALTKSGVVYQSDAGGLFELGRGIEPEPFGNDIIDSLDGRSVMGLDTDDKQRLFVSLAGAESEGVAPAALVFDQLSGVWTQFDLPESLWLAHTVRGEYAYLDAFSLWIHTPGSYLDTYLDTSLTRPIQTTIETEYYQLGGIKNFKRVWSQLVTGEYKAPHQFNAMAVTDFEAGTITTDYRFTPTTDGYCYDLAPTVEECQRVRFIFWDTFDGVAVPGDSYTLELVSFTVGTEKGLVRLPAANVNAGLTYLVGGTLSNLVGAGLTLRLNGGQDLILNPGDTSFQFPLGVASGMPYRVAIKRQPVGQTATVSFGAGTMGNATVSSVVITVV